MDERGDKTDFGGKKHNFYNKFARTDFRTCLILIKQIRIFKENTVYLI